jgi:hypothetical protein
VTVARGQGSGVNWAFLGFVGILVAQGAFRLLHDRSHAPAPGTAISEGRWSLDPVQRQRQIELEKARLLYQETLPFLRSLDARRGLPEDPDARRELRGEVERALRNLRIAQSLYRGSAGPGVDGTPTIDPPLVADRISMLETVLFHLREP